MPMPRSIAVAAFALAACSSHPAPAQGESAYSGAFEITGASLSGACALLLPAPGMQEPARARCVAEDGMVAELTGTALEHGAGYGTYELAGTGGGLTWGGWITIANAPGGGREAGGQLVANDGLQYWSGRIETLDEAASVPVPYCGTYTLGTEVDDFALVLGPAGAVGMAEDASGASRFLGLATRSGSTLTFTSLGGGPTIATAQIAPSLGSIDGIVTTPPATFSATPCDASVDHVCCGEGAATRCCFEAACPCP